MLGEGSTFYLSLPRLTPDEYEKRRVAEQSQDMIESIAAKTTNVMTPTEIRTGQVAAVPMQPAQMVPPGQMIAPGQAVPPGPMTPPGQMGQNLSTQNPNNNI